MILYQALQYPFHGKGSFRSLLILALIQLMPIVGQLILLGYGFDIVRAVYAGQTSLPPLRWVSALGDGLRFLLAGFAYLLPILVTIAVVGASSIGLRSGIGNLGNIGTLLAVGFPLLIFVIGIVSVRRTVSSSVQRTRVPGSGFPLVLTGLLPIVVTLLAIFLLRSLVSYSGIDTGKPNELSIVLFVVLALLIFLIGIGLSVGAVRHAVENKGLLAPTTNAKLLLKHPALTGMLLLNILVLDVLAVLATSVGLVLFILPGLLALVVFSLAFWYMFTQYSQRVGIQQSDFIFAKSTESLP